MRKRNVQILFRLNEEEADYLYDLVKRSGRSKEALLRSMVKGYRLCEKPDPEFYQIMRELSAIGNRINQLAVKANALDFVDTPMLREEVKKWREVLKLSLYSLMLIRIKASSRPNIRAANRLAK